MFHSPNTGFLSSPAVFLLLRLVFPPLPHLCSPLIISPPSHLPHKWLLSLMLLPHCTSPASLPKQQVPEVLKSVFFSSSTLPKEKIAKDLRRHNCVIMQMNPASDNWLQRALSPLTEGVWNEIWESLQMILISHIRFTVTLRRLCVQLFPFCFSFFFQERLFKKLHHPNQMLNFQNNEETNPDHNNLL